MYLKIINKIFKKCMYLKNMSVKWKLLFYLFTCANLKINFSLNFKINCSYNFIMSNQIVK